MTIKELYRKYRVATKSRVDGLVLGKYGTLWVSAEKVYLHFSDANVKPAPICNINSRYAIFRLAKKLGLLSLQTEDYFGFTAEISSEIILIGLHVVGAYLVKPPNKQKLPKHPQPSIAVEVGSMPIQPAWLPEPDPSFSLLEG